MSFPSIGGSVEYPQTFENTFVKEFRSFDTRIQTEALINEFKGNLFEFLVGQSLARHFQIETNFLNSFSGEIKMKLTEYEASLRIQYPELLTKLPPLAKEAAQKLLPYFPSEASEVRVIGKCSGREKEEWHEADLLIRAKDTSFPVSLKLCKENAFVNTKSGGVKSFLQKYFTLFPNIVARQEELNKFVDEHFVRMAYQLHELADLPCDGTFAQGWREAGLPELPGELNAEMNQIVLRYYEAVITFIHTMLENLLQEDRLQFMKALYPILGFGHENLTQLICFYSGDYELTNIDISTRKEIEKAMPLMTLGNFEKQKSSFEISLGERVLQIRVKPMNKFTVPGLKINCSVKRRSS